jgi:hypothetical protein
MTPPTKDRCIDHSGVIQKLNNNDRRLQNIENKVNDIDGKVDDIKEYIAGLKKEDEIKTSKDLLDSNYKLAGFVGFISIIVGVILKYLPF